MRLELPLALLLLVLPLIVTGTRAWLRKRGRLTGAMTISSLEIAGPVRRSWRTRLVWLPAALRCGALALLALAIARPQSGVSETRISTEGVAIQFVIDRSGSMREPMLLDGRAVTRLDAVKHVFGQFILGDAAASAGAPARALDASRSSDAELGGRPNDMIGVIAFAGFPETIVPLTRSRDVLVGLVDRLTPADSQIEQGTAIGDAMLQGAVWLDRAEAEIRKKRQDRLDDFKIKSKVLVLLTDGQDNRSIVKPIIAAHKAAEMGIKVYAIGVGAGRTDPFGREQVDRALLNEIARVTGGRFWLASDAEALRQIYEEIDALEKTRIEATEFTDYTERFPLLAMGAMALVALELLLSGAILRRIP